MPARKTNTPLVVVAGGRTAKPAPLVVSEATAAGMLALSTRTLQSMRVSGGGPRYLQLSLRRVGYAVAELEKWIERRSLASTSARRLDL